MVAKTAHSERVTAKGHKVLTRAIVPSVPLVNESLSRRGRCREDARQIGETDTKIQRPRDQETLIDLMGTKQMSNLTTVK